MKFELTILGCNSAVPAFNRNPSSQVLNVHDNLYLIDCGEGTQMQLSKFKIKRSKINQIFISHLHGDHYFGLLGLLNSYALNRREEPLTIFAPEGIEEIIEVHAKFSKGTFSFPLKIHLLETTKHQRIFEDDHVKVYSIPLSHRVPTSGFLFREKNSQRNINVDKIKEYNIPLIQLNSIQKGGDFVTKEGKIIPNNELVIEGSKLRSFAYCSDTIYDESIIPFIKEVDLLYHETTFMNDKEDFAKITHHTTASQAATIAKKARVNKLITGHYSSRYKDLKPLLAEAKAVFKSTVLGIEGTKYKVTRP